MHIADRLYGTATITSPVILAVLASKPLQRLRRIGQLGIPEAYMGPVPHTGFTRFDHSLGVALLLRHFGASEEEQLAGLLHDVSHTAFSHTVDWVLSTDHHVDDFQDTNHLRYLEGTEIPAILAAHGFDLARIADYEHFGLLEREIPDLCADRIDYFLRELPDEEAQLLLRHLCVWRGKFILDSREAAAYFARAFLDRQMQLWGGYEAVSRIQIFAHILNYAIDRRIIAFDDLWTDDEAVIAQLEGSGDSLLLGYLATLRTADLRSLPASAEPSCCKFRYVDPEFVSQGSLVRLSTVDQHFAAHLVTARQCNARGHHVARIVQ